MPCTAKATQEDFLCDSCRVDDDGACGVLTSELAGSHHVKSGIIEFGPPGVLPQLDGPFVWPSKPTITITIPLDPARLPGPHDHQQMPPEGQ